MSISVASPQRVNSGHLIAGLTGALTVHRLTKKIPVSTTKRLIVLALVAVAIAYWHRQSNSPMAGLFSTNRGSAQS